MAFLLKNKHSRRYRCIPATLQHLALVWLCSSPMTVHAGNSPIYTQQGSNWTETARTTFYSQDQGSRIMPLRWMQALKQDNGKPFLAGHLSRYGYLENAKSPQDLPLGFTVNGDAVGMTCAACHTRDIEVKGKTYRIDGGPAIVDFQSFALDLEAAVDKTLNDKQTFSDFAHAVLGGNPAVAEQNALHSELAAWFLPYQTIMDNALPKDKPWGPARLDAVGMIFNRLAGLDIGTSPDHIIKSNIHRADAPVRYPFIWNAPIQDKTQWPGFADNGNDVLALARNLGEVIGVFANFHPKKDDWRILGADFLHTNSANFAGLQKLEHLVKRIQPPQWPWDYDKTLAAEGKQLYESPTKTEGGGCVACHGIRDGAMRSLQKTWATPLCAVETDEKQFELLQWTVDTGELAGAQIPFLEKPLKAKDELAVKVLGATVIGSIIQHASPIAMTLESRFKADVAHLERLLGVEKSAQQQKLFAELRALQSQLISPDNIDLKGAFRTLSTSNSQAPKDQEYPCKQNFDDATPKHAYEARVLQGIWATAPYLHNGAIPTLAALLEPAEKRPASFKIGPNYDPEKVGLALEQSKFGFELQTTTCQENASGNSRCGHEFGTHLSAHEKAALLEYLKIL